MRAHLWLQHIKSPVVLTKNQKHLHSAKMIGYVKNEMLSIRCQNINVTNALKSMTLFEKLCEKENIKIVKLGWWTTSLSHPMYLLNLPRPCKMSLQSGIQTMWLEIMRIGGLVGIVKRCSQVMFHYVRNVKKSKMIEMISYHIA